MSTTTATCWESVDAAIDARAERAFCFLERLVAEPSTVGQERGAQELVANELAILRFGVSRLEIPAETAAGAPGGVAQAPPQVDAGGGVRRGARRGAARHRGGSVAGCPSAGHPANRLPGRGVPAARRPSAGERAGGRPRRCPWQHAAAAGPRRHHGRALLPQPVRQAGRCLRARGTEHPCCR